MTATTKIELEGNFFHRDPGKTLMSNIRDMDDNLAEWMQSEVGSEIAGHAGSMPNYTGWTASHVLGRTHSVSGKRWGQWAVVSESTAGMSAKLAIRTQAAAASIERRWHPYRRVKSAIYRARPIISADLTKGLE